MDGKESRLGVKKEFVQIRQDSESLVHFVAGITSMKTNFLIQVDYASLHADIGLILDATYS